MHPFEKPSERRAPDTSAIEGPGSVTEVLHPPDATDEEPKTTWIRAEESAILDTMLSDLDVAIYAKDEQARHVKVSDVKGGPSPEEQYGKTDREIRRCIKRYIARRVWRLLENTPLEEAA
jgi:hypothetical protein